MNSSDHDDDIKVTDRRGQDKPEPAATEHVASDTKSAQSDHASKQERERGRYTGPLDFTTFILSLSSSALVAMGIVPDPISKRTEKNIDLARQQIDIIEMMEQKTKGNCTPEEVRLLQQVLYELRLRFVQVKES